MKLYAFHRARDSLCVALSMIAPVRQHRRATVHTLGCRLNQSESQMLRDQLEDAGYEIVPFGRPADLGIINTCTVTREADAKCRKLIRSFTTKNPRAFTAVIGCYSQMGAEVIAGIPGVDLIIGNQEKMSVLDYVELGKNETPVIVRDRIDRTDFTLKLVGDFPFPERANLKVQDGCDFMCGFCVIPFARGRARARDWENTLAEARSLAERGVKEIVLTGVNIGTYDSGGRGIVALIDALDAIPGIRRIRISSIEPTTVPQALFERMAAADHALLPYLHLPLQAGSDRVLERMRRKYSLREYANFVTAAMDAVPDLCLGTDIMVGFAGERIEDFEATCAFFLEQPFAYCHVFPYSEREGTLSVKQGERDRSEVVPMEERQRRCAQLRRLSAKKRHDQMSAAIGNVREVLFEHRREDRWPGYTDNYIRVVCDSPDGSDLHNRRARVRLKRVAADFMEGEVVELLDATAEVVGGVIRV